MVRELWSALGSGRPTWVHPRSANTATMDIIHTRARLTVTTALVISPRVFLSVPDRGSAAIMAARAFTVAPGIFMAVPSFTVAMTSMIVDMATSDADTMMMASAVVTNAAVAIEETSGVGTNAEITKE